MHDQHVLHPEADAVTGSVVSAVDVLVFLIDIDAAGIVAKVIGPIQLGGSIHKFTHIRLEQPARHAGGLAGGEAIVIDA